MANLYSEASKNITKTWILMSIVFLLVIALGWFFSIYFNNPSIVIVFSAFAIVLNIVSYWYSDKVVIKLSGARPATREEFFDLYTTVENLSITAGLPMPKLYVVEDSAPNAFATGRDQNHSAVCVTTGLLAVLNKPELEGVIAHELSHIGNRDMLVSTVVVVLVGFISIAADIFMRNLWWSGGRRNSEREGESGNMLMIAGIILAIISPIIGTLIQLAISRHREYLADASGALLTRYPEGLASALAKIQKYSAPLIHQSNAISHLYIADPAGGRKTAWYKSLLLTHPPIRNRIIALLGDKAPQDVTN